MRIAIVHDYLSQRGGAERVVLELTRLLPDAPVYTSFYAADRTYPQFADVRVITTGLQACVDPEHFRRSVLRFPGTFRDLDLSDYDAVVVSSSAFAHHIRHPRSVVYCYTPPRFLYAPESYLGARWAAEGARTALRVLRRADRRAAQRHPLYLAASRTSAQRILTAYGRHATVVYPPLCTDHLPSQPQPAPREPRALVVSRLLPYKRVDVAVEACRRAGIGLTVVGTGPDDARLRRLAGSSVVFAGRLTDLELRAAFVEASVILAPGEEDFGFAPVEANFAGRPVVALAAGGALETVRPGRTGALVRGWDPEDWAAALKDVAGRPWDPAGLRATTAPFRAEVFEVAVRSSLAVVCGLPAVPPAGTGASERAA